MSDKLQDAARRLAERITATDDHPRYLNQAEQRLLARAYLALANTERKP
jgi:hypothetical protein